MTIEKMPKKVAIFIFDEIEELDMCGPLEVFAATKDNEGLKAFDVSTVAENDNPIVCTNGLSVNPTYTVANCPQPDILVLIRRANRFMQPLAFHFSRSGSNPIPVTKCLKLCFS